MSDSPDRPPRADQRPTVLSAHGEERVDEYYWLRDREDPAVKAYLEAENAWTQRAMAPTEALQETLYKEMVGRIQETDQSVPAPDGPYVYYYRTFEGKQYAVHCRRPREAKAIAGGEDRILVEAAEEVLFDENEMAAGSGFFHLGAMEVSPDHRLAAYVVDTSGAEQYDLRIRDLQGGTDLPASIPNCGDSIAWASDNQTVFYVTLDETLRPHQVWRYRVGEPAGSAELLFQEDDERLFVSVHRTLSGGFIVMDLSGHVTSEQRVLEADDPTGAFRVVAPRRRGVEYEVCHHGDRFFILTNDGAVNFRLMEMPCARSTDDPGNESWREVIPHRDSVYLTGVTALQDHLIVYERDYGLPQIRVRRLSTGEEHLIAFDEPTYALDEGDVCEFDSDVLRFEYSSMVTPRSVFDYDLIARTRVLLKETPVRGGYDKNRYVTERVFATAVDGTAVPISLVYKKGTYKKEVHADRALALGEKAPPCLLYGYGSYGIDMPARFTSDRLSLLDRGFVFAIAHIRGGGDLGRSWYNAGKFLEKKTTFGDFVACAEHLIAQGYAAPDRLAIQGGSAGGLLIGATLNLRRDLFRAAILQVPFLDVLTSMLDDSLPLTISEYEEWGDPNDRAYFDAIKAYSPYDNMAEGAYPAILVTAGWNDPRVPFWEPAKWVARLRERKTDDALLLLRTNLGAGHRGASGRYDWLREKAMDMAFLLFALDRMGGQMGGS